MAASPHLAERGDPPPHEKWANLEDQQPDSMGPAGDISANNGAPVSDDRERAGNDSGNPEYARSSGPGDGVSGKLGPPAYREKQIKPNKVYIGGLPENTRQEDLQNCFGKIGNITNIELKVGYGFVEFDSREAAEESVAKYNEGFFMGNKIRVEISRGGGRYAKYSGDPGACFKCGQMGHWARECGNHSVQSDRRSAHGGDQPLIDRIQPSRDYAPPHPPRDYPYRDDYPPGRYPPSRDSRYSYDYPPPRRPVSPPRDYRDYPPPPPRRGEPDDYRMRGPPPPPPPPRYESRAGYYPPEDLPGYARGYPAPPPRDYDRYDRRAPPGDRYAYHAPPPRARTPPPAAPPSRARDDFERPATRDYPPPPPPPSDFRARPVTPPPARYADYPPRNGASEGRYRRRSQSPPPRTSTAAYEPYPPASGYSAPPKGSSRDYPRGGRDAELSSSYRRP